jgi:voltage-gated potassium channel
MQANTGHCENAPGAFYGNACEFRNTWVQFQIMNDKLHSDGGSQISRYLRALNWAIPTMVLYTVGDVYPMNVNENSYLFGAMFFGISINALIIGSIIALVSTLDEELTGITTKSDLLRDHLKLNNIDDKVIHKVRSGKSNYLHLNSKLIFAFSKKKVTAFMNYLLTDAGQLLMKEEAMYAELPHTLQVAVSTHAKLKFFKQCPFFDFCSEEVLRNLCMVMKPQVFYTGDMIISFGDLGQEMFFIERGTVEVMSADGKTKYATLQVPYRRTHLFAY